MSTNEAAPTAEEIAAYRTPQLDRLAYAFIERFRRSRRRADPTFTALGLNDRFEAALLSGIGMPADVDLDMALREGLHNPAWWPRPLGSVPGMSAFLGDEEPNSLLSEVHLHSGRELIVALVRTMVTRRAIELDGTIVVLAIQRR